MRLSAHHSVDPKLISWVFVPPTTSSILSGAQFVALAARRTPFPSRPSTRRPAGPLVSLFQAGRRPSRRRQSPHLCPSRAKRPVLYKCRASLLPTFSSYRDINQYVSASQSFSISWPSSERPSQQPQTIEHSRITPTPTHSARAFRQWPAQPHFTSAPRSQYGSWSANERAA